MSSAELLRHLVSIPLTDIFIEVAEILRSRGFRVAVVGSTPYPGVAAGIVIRQSPQGGFQIGPGEPISLEVSR